MNRRFFLLGLLMTVIFFCVTTVVVEASEKVTISEEEKNEEEANKQNDIMEAKSQDVEMLDEKDKEDTSKEKIDGEEAIDELKDTDSSDTDEKIENFDEFEKDVEEQAEDEKESLIEKKEKKEKSKNENLRINSKKKKKKKKEKKAKEEKSIISFTEEEFKILSSVVFLEAGNQSFKGKVAVANAILNRVQDKAFPNTIKKVIYQKAYGYYQFGLAKPGGKLEKAMKIYGKRVVAWERKAEAEAIKAAKAALYGERVIPEHLCFFVMKNSIPGRRYRKNKPGGVIIQDHYFYKW